MNKFVKGLKGLFSRRRFYVVHLSFWNFRSLGFKGAKNARKYILFVLMHGEKNERKLYGWQSYPSWMAPHTLASARSTFRCSSQRSIEDFAPCGAICESQRKPGGLVPFSFLRIGIASSFFLFFFFISWFFFLTYTPKIWVCSMHNRNMCLWKDSVHTV